MRTGEPRVCGESLRGLGRQSLPVPLTSFVGRKQELAEVGKLLETTRLLTLAGPGGIGKTRVAVQVVQNAHFEAIEFVDLAPLTDAALVPQAVAASLGVSEQPGYPIVAALIAALQSRSRLLILDNCEQLLAAWCQPGRDTASELRATQSAYHQSRDAWSCGRGCLAGDTPDGAGFWNAPAAGAPA